MVLEHVVDILWRFRRLLLVAAYAGVFGLVVRADQDIALMTLAHDIISRCALFPSKFDPADCKNDPLNHLVDDASIKEMKNKMFSFLYSKDLGPLADANRSVIQQVKRDSNLENYLRDFKIPSGTDTAKIRQVRSPTPLNSHEYVYLLECLTGAQIIVPESHLSCGTGMFGHIMELVMNPTNIARQIAKSAAAGA